MKRRIFRTLLLAIAAALTCALIAVSAALLSYFSDVSERNAASLLSLAVQGVEHSEENYLSDLDVGDMRVTWIAADGTVLADSQAGQLDNHFSREEFQQALKTGYGRSDRTSDTLGMRMIYLAQRMSDGTVLRLAYPQRTSLSLFLGLLPVLLAMFVLFAFIAANMSHELAQRIIAPLERLDLERPFTGRVYEELTPMLNYIEEQRQRISEQLGDLTRRKLELSAIIDHMREGLVLLGGSGEVLLSNPAACEILGARSAAPGKNFLRFDAGSEVAATVRAALKTGHGETHLVRGGSEYQLSCNGVGEAGAYSGAVLLLLDVTAQARLERNRREFTANVSHELKTPLQTIMGSAELIENGLVKSDDLSRFAGSIRAQSARLVTLINDIIRLSQLDEGETLERETVDIYEVARETLLSLEDVAKSRNVGLSLRGEAQSAPAVRRLVQEIVFNLCDNAIKYNRDGGSVFVTVSRADEGVILTVADDGIGIPAAHQERVFERFYRVDKSRSRNTGGTGLGLSIVKHAVQDLGAVMALESEEGQGTVIRVTFKG